MVAGEFAKAGRGSDAVAKCTQASASISLRNAADVFSLACMVEEDSNLFDHKVYQGISHLADPLERRWKDAARQMLKFHPYRVEGTFTVDVLDGWSRGKPLADQKRAQSANFKAEFTENDASTYVTLANRVLGKKMMLPKSYSAKQLADIRGLMLLEMRILHKDWNVEDNEDGLNNEDDAS